MLESLKCCMYINVRLFFKKRIYVLYIYQTNLELGRNFFKL